MKVQCVKTIDMVTTVLREIIIIIILLTRKNKEDRRTNEPIFEIKRLVHMKKINSRNVE